MFCPNCGVEQADESRFCSACGKKIGDDDYIGEDNYVENDSQGILEELTVPSINKHKKPVYYIVAVIALIAIGLYIFAAYIPPSFAKSIKSLEKLTTYKQELIVDVPYQSQFRLISSIDNQQKLGYHAIKTPYYDNAFDIYTEPGRIIASVPYYSNNSYVAVELMERNNENIAKEYLNYVDKELSEILKVLKKDIIKPNAESNFKRTTITTPENERIKVKQYKIKITDENIYNAIYDSANRINIDNRFRSNINSFVNKSIDFFAQNYGSSLDKYSRDELDYFATNIIDGIDEMAKEITSSDHRNNYIDDFRGGFVELSVSYDNKNRPVEISINLYSPDDGNVMVKSTFYGFNKPVQINLPRESKIVETINLNDLGNWIF